MRATGGSERRQPRRDKNGDVARESKSPSARPTRAPWFNPRDLIAPGILFALACLVYIPALRAQFLWDDNGSIAKNLLLRRPDGIWRFWTTIGRIPSEEHYWPLTYSVLWLEWQCWGNWPAGFHCINILLHCAIIVQIWRLMRRMGLAGAWIGAALFAFHPVHVEAVAWVIGIKDLLAAFFYLLAIDFFLNHHDFGGRKWLALSAVSAAAAMSSKSSPMTLPFALAILVWYRGGRFTRRDLVGIFVIAAVTLTFAAIDMWSVRTANYNPDLIWPPFFDRLVQAGYAFWFYLAKLVLPIGLSPIYPRWDASPARIFNWLPLAAIVCVSVCLIVLTRRIGRGPLACWLFYGLTLGPVLGLVYFVFLTSSPAADRYQYLASIGPLAALGAWIGNGIARRARARIAFYSSTAFVLAVIFAMTWRQAVFFHDSETLFLRALRINPDSPDVYFHLGNAAWDKQRLDEAETHFSRALQIKPDFWQAACSLGLVLNDQRRVRDAVAVHRRAIDSGCKYPGILANQAWLLATSGDPRVRDPRQALRLAEECVRRAARMDPSYLNALAAAQAANGQFTDAAATARKALELANESVSPMAPAIEKLVRLYEGGHALATH